MWGEKRLNHKIESKMDTEREQKAKEQQLELLREVFAKCWPPTPVFKPGHEGVPEDAVPYIIALPTCMNMSIIFVSFQLLISFRKTTLIRKKMGKSSPIMIRWKTS